MVAIGGNKIRDVTIGSDLDDFLLREAAEIKDFAIGIPGQPFRNEIFLLSDESQSGVSFRRKIAVNFFDEFREFVGSTQACKCGIAGRIETFAKRYALFEKFCDLESYAEMLV